MTVKDVGTFTILDQPQLGRGRNPIVIWNWVWFRPMWKYNPLGVMQMKWQIQEVEWHRLICQSQMCPHFHHVFILWAPLDPGGTGAAGWLWGVWSFSRTLGNELGLKFRESRKRFNSSSGNLDRLPRTGVLHWIIPPKGLKQSWFQCILSYFMLSARFVQTAFLNKWVSGFETSKEFNKNSPYCNLQQ